MLAGWPGLTLRVGAALMLVALAAVDQWRYLLALGGSDRSSLERARTLNPYDSAVHLRLAGAARQSGDADAEERELRRAIAINPQSVVPYHALERFLIESGRLADAYAHCRLLLEKWPREIDTLVNAGILAQRLGDGAAAEDVWRRALATDSSLAEVHLYLAEMLDAAGRVADAVPHYRGYLELVVRQRDEQRHAPRRVALTVVKFADALVRTGQPALARSQYDLAARIAQQRGLGDVEAEARDRLRALAGQ